MRFVFLRAEFCRQLPSDSTSRWTPLLLTSGWRLQTPTVDFHHLVSYHARHTKKKPLVGAAFIGDGAQEGTRTPMPEGTAA
jgi:hypothetical protein